MLTGTQVLITLTLILRMISPDMVDLKPKIAGWLVQVFEI